LFTDIEGSTKMWERSPQAMRSVLSRHDEILRHVTQEREGYVFKTVGDAFCVAFSTAPDALEAALEAQRSLLDEEWQETWPLRVRMALHTGAAEERDATTSALRSTGWRGCSALLTELRCSYLWRLKSSCATSCRPT
jgi:class 3 adenylate cyclase